MSISVSVPTPTAPPVFVRRNLKPSKQPAAPSLRAVYEKAKIEANGGIVLFEMSDKLCALFEDAETIADVLGIVIRFQLGRSPSVTLTRKHLQRNIRLLQAEGHQVYTCGDASVNDTGRVENAA